jgi:DNA polymerase-3 subunit alpha
MVEFVHLHLHSQYSLLDGANRLDDLVAAAAGARMPALAVTDHGNLFGAVEFHRKARKAGIKPILGIEAYVAQGSRLDRDPARGSSNHLVLLARDEAGFRNLIRLTSRSYLEGHYYKPRIDKELLREHADGLIALSACLKGEINEQIVARREDVAEALAREYLEIFGEGNFYLELQNHGIPEQQLANDALRRLSRRNGIPLVATNDCHYLHKGDAFAHDVLLCIGTQRTLADTDRLKYHAEEFYLKDGDAMARLFPQDAAAIENTLAIAERCNVDLPTGAIHLPEFPVPAGETSQSYFDRLARQGLEERLRELGGRRARGLVRHAEADYWSRLEEEIRVIERLGFTGYFLIVWDFIRYAREQSIPVGPGRGSAAGSLVSYALRITDIDPLEYDLVFERFLNPERVNLPDIDIDFCMRGRGQVIQYVSEKYGRDRVAQIITFGTLAAKAVIRDVGRVMGVPFAKVDRIAKLIPDMTKSLAEAAREIDALKQEAAADAEIRNIVEVGSRLEGLTRHASLHAAGVVITPRPIQELVPLYKTSKDEIVTQWDKDVVEDLGLLKMDFLGLRTLTVIDDTVKLLRHQGIELDLDAVPLDDPDVYRLFCEARTNGIFQFESSGMKDLLRRAQPSKFEDLAAFNALYRPGALSVGMVDEYIQRKTGRRKVRYVLPETREILEETCGVICYQEQVMQIAVRIAGFTMGEADVLRKAMGKKKAEVMAEQKEKFVAGAAGRGFARAKAAELWEFIEPFAGYGFNKSHSVAYAMLAYKTAYLKAHHPVAFMAAMLSSESGDSDQIAKYVAECREMGIEVAPPDVNASSWSFLPQGQRILFGLGAVKGVGEAAAESILEARRRIGRFRSLAHLATEVDSKGVHHKVLESLIRAGACDGLGPSRSTLAASLDSVLDFAQSRRAEREMGQGALFGASASLEPTFERQVQEWSESERLGYEKETLGLYLSGNPLHEHRPTLERLGTATSADVREGLVDGAVTMGGIVTRMRRVKIKSGPNAGRLMGRFVLEDLHGSLPAALFADAMQRCGAVAQDGAAVLVKGVLRGRGAEAELAVEELTPLAALADGLVTAVEVRLRPDLTAGDLLRVRDALVENSGEVPVTFRLEVAGYEVAIRPQERFRVQWAPRLRASLEAVLGGGAVEGRLAPVGPGP